MISGSYYDSQTSGLSVAVGSDDRDNSGAIDGEETATAGAEGKTTAELMDPTAYDGIYADWNLDSDDADADGDDPWDFGDNTRYPALKADFDGNSTATWQEFGYQVRRPMPLTATPSGSQVSLSWAGRDRDGLDRLAAGLLRPLPQRRGGDRATAAAP